MTTLIDELKRSAQSFLTAKGAHSITLDLMVEFALLSASKPAAPMVGFTVDCSQRIDDVLPADRRWTIANAIGIVAEYRNCEPGETKEVMQRFADYMRAALVDAAVPAQSGVIASAEALIAADRAQGLTTEHVNALENAIAIQRRTVKMPAPAPAPAQSADPVAWRLRMEDGSFDYSDCNVKPNEVDLLYAREHGHTFEPLYAAPQPSRIAVVLDDERAAFEEARLALEDAYSFTSTPRPALEKISIALDKLEQIEKARAASPHPVAQPVEQTADSARLRFLADDIADADVRRARNELLERMPVMSYSAVCMQIDAILIEHGLALNVAPQNNATSISDAMMDLVDRLGHEWKDVDPRAWSRLLVYAPQPVEQTRELTDHWIDMMAVDACVAGDSKGRLIFTRDAARSFARDVRRALLATARPASGETE